MIKTQQGCLTNKPKEYNDEVLLTAECNILRKFLAHFRNSSLKRSCEGLYSQHIRW